MSDNPETVAQQLAEELEGVLDRRFKATADYREAIETVHCHFDVILAGLDEDARRDEAQDDTK